MRILLIHGIAQGGKNPDDLKEAWVKTLEAGFKKNNTEFPGNISVDFPFYGDRLDEFTLESSLPTSEDILQKGSGQNMNFEHFMQSALMEMKNTKNISDSEILKLVNNTGAQERDIQNWGWVRGIARYIDNNFIDTTEFVIESFLKDVYLYINSPKVTNGINQIVNNMLTDEPTIIIGHSLGSVVGYKVIMENLSTLHLVKYITVGSPLGIKAISSKLGVAENPTKLGWYNAFDPRDIVALHPLNSEYFPALPAISNYDSVNNHTDNRHGITGYLNDADVAKEVAIAMKLGAS